LGDESTGDPNNSCSLGSLKVFEAFLLAGHSYGAESIDPYLEGVGVKAWSERRVQQRYHGLVGMNDGASGYTTMQVSAVAKVEMMRQAMERAADEALHTTTNQEDKFCGTQGKCKYLELPCQVKEWWRFLVLSLVC